MGHVQKFIRRRKKPKPHAQIKHQNMSFGELWDRVVSRDHPLMKIFVVRPHLTCTQRCMVFSTALVGSIFVSALFFPMPSPSGEADEVPMEVVPEQESIMKGIFGILFNAPFPIAVTFLCRKKVILRKMKLERKLKVMKMWRLKSAIGMAFGGFF